MTPLVLAVWYMDDGDLNRDSYPRITFGLDAVSLKRAVQALQTLGLHPKVYGEGGDCEIQFPKQAFEFRQLVEPFMIPCMAYKLPMETPRQEGDRRARKLTSEKAAALYTGGMSAEEISQMYGVGTSTVGRRLQNAGVGKRRSGPRSQAYTQETAQALLEGYDLARWPKLSTEEQAQWVAEILRVLRASPFPVRSFPEGAAVQKALIDVRSAEMSLVGDRIMPIRRMGVACCNSFFPNRYKAASRGVISAYESWHRDKDLERAIRFQLNVGDPVVPHRVLRAITMQCRTPTVFRPTAARFVYDHLCPRGGKTWDPCSGYGGRLLGAVAAGVEYVGTDVEPETVRGNNLLAGLLGSTAQVHLSPAEDFAPPEVDLVFTSPPYFNREAYSGRADQSWVKYQGFDAWVEGFLRPVIRRSSKAACLALNICDIRFKKERVPLEATTCRVAAEEGFKLTETLYLPLSDLNRQDPKEPIFVFRRTAI